jgi:isoleucyl-tRNA synthetase
VFTHGFTLDEHGRKMSKSVGNVVAPQKITDEYGADILRLWVMNSDITEDQRIGKEILKQQAELYRRLRNTLRWLLGSLHGFSEAERMDVDDMPELERFILHRLGELDAKLRAAVQSYDFTGFYPELHAFCAADLSAFYFDIRKDSLYCDRPDAPKRRAARTVLDILHRCLCTWLAPVLCFTAEDAFTARFGEDRSVHLETFPELPDTWRNPALAEKWAAVRSLRGTVTAALEEARRSNAIGSSLQASVEIAAGAPLLDATDWADIAIVSAVSLLGAEGETAVSVARAAGEKCARCWKVLEEVGSVAAHPTLCLRCADAVESGLVCSTPA